MTITLDAWLKDLNFMVGAEFPSADEDALWRCAHAWAVAAAELRGLAPAAVVAGAHVIEGLGGETRDAFVALWRRLAADGDGFIDRLAHACDQLAAACDQAAIEVEYAKLQYIGALVTLGAAIAACLAAIWLGGVSAAGIPVAVATAQFTIRLVLVRLLSSIVFGAGLNVAVDAAAQGLQLLVGHRTQWDAAKTVRAAEDGAIFGATTGGAFLAAGRFAPGIAGTRPGTLAVGTAGATAGGVLAPAVHGELPTGEDFVMAMSSGLFGSLGPHVVRRDGSGAPPDLSRLATLDPGGLPTSAYDRDGVADPMAAVGAFDADAIAEPAAAVGAFDADAVADPTAPTGAFDADAVAVEARVRPDHDGSSTVDGRLSTSDVASPPRDPDGYRPEASTATVGGARPGPPPTGLAGDVATSPGPRVEPPPGGGGPASGAPITTASPGPSAVGALSPAGAPSVGGPPPAAGPAGVPGAGPLTAHGVLIAGSSVAWPAPGMAPGAGPSSAPGAGTPPAAGPPAAASASLAGPLLAAGPAVVVDPGPTGRAGAAPLGTSAARSPAPGGAGRPGGPSEPAPGGPAPDRPGGPPEPAAVAAVPGGPHEHAPGAAVPDGTAEPASPESAAGHPDAASEQSAPDGAVEVWGDGVLTDAQVTDLVRRSAFGTKAGWCFYPAGDDLRSFASAIRPTPGYVTVDLHGSPRGFTIGEQRFTPEQFGRALRELIDTGAIELPSGAGLKLLSCDTAYGGSDSPAARLARELGVEVIAPDQPVWTGLDGKEVVSSPVPMGGVFVPKFPPDGHWHRFDPGGAEVPLAFDPGYHGDYVESVAQSELNRWDVRPRAPDPVDVAALVGADPRDVIAGIPAGWIEAPSRSGGGVVFRDPDHPGRQIRVMPGYSAGNRPDPRTHGPYAEVSQNGVKIKVPLLGNPTLGEQMKSRVDQLASSLKHAGARAGDD